MKASVHRTLLAVGLNGALFSALQAAELDSLRLFHESGTATIEKHKSKQPKVNLQQMELLSGVTDDGDPDSSTALNTTYLYNGFILSEKGMHYFINSTPIKQLNTIKLVSVIKGGRTLVLETKSGQKFSLSIGDVRLVATRLNDLPNSSSNPAKRLTTIRVGEDDL